MSEHEIKPEFSVGEIVIAKAAPASIYHLINDEEVKIIGISIEPNDHTKSKFIYTFRHDETGFGAMYEHGFKKLPPKVTSTSTKKRRRGKRNGA
ncbi:hypothetical protein VCHA53O466_50515 [Vibrio chagasii]|nr:hypothetical protein VCHA53O466_50515 [Vibrio chagasii]